MTRSESMSRIKSKGNKSTELVLATHFRRNHVKGWRRHQRVEGVNVDFVFRKWKLLVFADGCFWHGCPEHCKLDCLNAYWYHKIDGNRRRDWHQDHKLETAGWRVRRIWEHELEKLSKGQGHSEPQDTQVAAQRGVPAQLQDAREAQP